MSINVVIVEDSDVEQQHIVACLKSEKFDFKIVLASNGKDAFNKVKKWDSIDLVLCDLVMPEMDGITFIQKLRHKSEVPIIVISSLGTQKLQRYAVSCGANLCLTKPMDAKPLAKAVRKFINP